MPIYRMKGDPKLVEALANDIRNSYIMSSRGALLVKGVSEADVRGLIEKIMPGGRLPELGIPAELLDWKREPAVILIGSPTEQATMLKRFEDAVPGFGARHGPFCSIEVKQQ